MSKLREAKEVIVQKITTKITAAKSTFFVEYLGLTVFEMTNLRNELKTEGIELKVYKNRLVKIAAKNAGFNGLEEALLGPNAIAFSSEDQIAAARIIAEHAKKNDVLKFKAGIFEGKVVDAEMVILLSQIPSRETLLTQIAAGLLQPLKKMAIGLNMLEASQVSGSGEQPIPVIKEATTPTEEAAPAEETVEAAEVKPTVAEAPAEAEAK